jgi:hypothetical protein
MRDQAVQVLVGAGHDGLAAAFGQPAQHAGADHVVGLHARQHQYVQAFAAQLVVKAGQRIAQEGRHRRALLAVARV